MALVCIHDKEECKVKKEKFVPLEKRSKRAQREEWKKQRSGWGGLCPATRIAPNRRKLALERIQKAEAMQY